MMADRTRLIVLEDGETWGETAYVVEVSDEAYEKVLDDHKIRNIEEGITVVQCLGPDVRGWLECK